LLIVIRWRLQALVHPAIRAWLDQDGLAAPWSNSAIDHWPHSIAPFAPGTSWPLLTESKIAHLLRVAALRFSPSELFQIALIDLFLHLLLVR
jgi:hypothetical protein